MYSIVEKLLSKCCTLADRGQLSIEVRMGELYLSGCCQFTCVCVFATVIGAVSHVLITKFILHVHVNMYVKSSPSSKTSLLCACVG